MNHHRYISERITMDEETLLRIKKTIHWFYFLLIIAICNVSLWYYIIHLVTVTVNNKRMMKETAIHSLLDYYQTYHLMLSSIYVFACTYRYILPRMGLHHNRSIEVFSKR